MHYSASGMLGSWSGLLVQLCLASLSYAAPTPASDPVSTSAAASTSASASISKLLDAFNGPDPPYDGSNGWNGSVPFPGLTAYTGPMPFNGSLPSNVSTGSVKWTHNCQANASAEKESWDASRILARSAKLWKKNGNYQQTADFWFGKDSADQYGRIQDYFQRALEFHDWTFWPGTEPQNAYSEVWCTEHGPDGIPRRPEDRDPSKPWNADKCGPLDWAYSYRVKQIFPPAPLSHVYITVYCPRIWTSGSVRDSKVTMKRMEDNLLAYYDGRDREDPELTIDLLWKVRGATQLHEILHHQIVSNPTIQDVVVKGSDWDTHGVPIYGPAAAAGFAKNQGALQKVPPPPTGGGYDGVNGGEFGTVINADNYALFALSIHFQELLRRNSPIKPMNPTWDKIKKEYFDPFPGRKTDGEGVSTHGPDTVLEPPSPLPQSSSSQSPTPPASSPTSQPSQSSTSATPSSPPPSATEKCHTQYKVVLDSFSIEGHNFNETRFGPADGSNLKKQINGCGALTTWKYHGDATSFTASGNLPIGINACLERALKTAGGEGVCDGSS